jgi:hypothetical protein
LAVCGPQILSVQILAPQVPLVREGLSAAHAMVGERAIALAAQRSGLHPGAAARSQVLAAHGVLRGEPLAAAAADRRTARLAEAADVAAAGDATTRTAADVAAAGDATTRTAATCAPAAGGTLVHSLAATAAHGLRGCDREAGDKGRRRGRGQR